MIGPQNGAVRSALRPLLNGIVNYEYWVPVPSLAFDGVAELLKVYRERTPGADADPLGHYIAPLAYAQMQVVAQAIEGTGSLEDLFCQNSRGARNSRPSWARSIWPNGEWAKPRVLQVQFQNTLAMASNSTGTDRVRSSWRRARWRQES